MDANAGITCAHSAAAANAYSVKASASSQNVRWRKASRSVVSAAALACDGATACSLGPRSAHQCSGTTTASSVMPIATSVPRQPSDGISQATAGNDSVLAKPPTSVSAVMPWR